MAGADDFAQRMMAFQQSITQQNGGSNGFLGIRDVDCFSSMSLKSGALKDQPLRMGSGKQRAVDGLLSKLGLSSNAMIEDFKKCAANAGIIYQGEVTTGAPSISLGLGGGSFASNVGGGGRGDMDIG